MTKNLERKKKGQTQGRTNRRMPICNPTIQLVVVDLYTKYEVSILNGCGDIFDEKVLLNYGRTDGTTDRCKPVYPPLFQSGGIINTDIHTWWYVMDTDTTAVCAYYILYMQIFLAAFLFCCHCGTMKFNNKRPMGHIAHLS